MSFLNKLFGDPNEKFLKTLQPIIDKINDFESDITALNDDQLKQKTLEFKKRLQEGETKDDILPEVFAVAREATKRTIGQRHYDVQLLGGIVLHQGQIAEMKTGEGKTQTALLASYLNALDGKGVHIVTVNDYLAKRDAVWMGHIYSFLGLTVGCLQNMSAFRLRNEDSSEDNDAVNVDMDKLESVHRREVYKCDILFGTNSEFGFDYLRDNMVMDVKDAVQNPLAFAIIDEVDSILIDEARTPLIISAPAQESSEKYYQFAQLVKVLVENEDYNIDEKMRAATLSDAGITKLEKALGVENIYVESGLSTVHHIEQALRANTLYKNDRDYVIKDGEVVIVDEFTGRLMYGRRYGEGLHQAIEAKENVSVQQESQTLATITIQNYFRLYDKLSGMTGTAATEAEEFSKIYKLDVTIVPTHKILARQDLSDRIYQTESGKFKAIAREIKEKYEKGQPVLVGTISIEKNEELGDLLAKEGVPYNLLNAKHHEKEAEIIAQAGKKGAVTIATNMAGRGVDIILGGNPATKEETEAVKEMNGLCVIGTERHESRRIDNQLRGRSGRQGDNGETRFYISLEDDLMRIFGPMQKMKGMMAKLGLPDDMPIENKMVSNSIEAAQKKVEGHNFDVRKHVVEYDDVINKHRDVVYKKRREVLEIAEKDISGIKDKVWQLIEFEIEQVVSFHTSAENRSDWNIQEIVEVASTIFSVPTDLKEKLSGFEEGVSITKEGDAEVRTKIIEYLLDLGREIYEKLEKDVIELSGNDAEVMRDIERGVLLRSIDSLWMEHLTAMDHLRTGVRLRGYAQKDPLVEYKKEGYRMFNELLNLIQKQVVYSIFKVGLASNLAGKSLLQRSGIKMSAPEKSSEKSTQIVSNKNKVDGKKVGRNDPCPCGSGKKYKKCCGLNN